MLFCKKHFNKESGWFYYDSDIMINVPLYTNQDTPCTIQIVPFNGGVYKKAIVLNDLLFFEINIDGQSITAVMLLIPVKL